MGRQSAYKDLISLRISLYALCGSELDYEKMIWVELIVSQNLLVERLIDKLIDVLYDRNDKKKKLVSRKSI